MTVIHTKLLNRYKGDKADKFTNHPIGFYGTLLEETN